MKSKTSFINKGILRNDFKRFSWIGVVYLLGLFFGIPLQIFMLYSKYEETAYISGWNFLRIFRIDSSPLLIILIYVVPILAGLVLFRYLQAGKASDMEHALPVKRETIYNTHIIAGVVCLVVPIVLTALVSWLLVNTLGISDALTTMNATVNGAENMYNMGTVISAWLVTSVVFSLLLFITSVAVGMITGMSTLQGVLSYIFLLLPAGFSLLILHNVSLYVYGFALDYYIEPLGNLSPLVRLGQLRGKFMPITETSLYVVIIVILYFLGRFLYKRRPLESAGNAVAFNIMHPILKYGVTFCCMLLIGSYFNEAMDCLGWTYFGYVMGALISYILMEILLNKSLYIFQWKRFKGLGVYSLIAIAFIAILQFDLIGYETRMPDLDQVNRVCMGSSFYEFTNEEQMNSLTADAFYGRRIVPLYTEKENIANIYNLHKIITEKQSEGLSSSERSRYDRICLVYEMKNGKRMYRQYRIPVQDYDKQLKPIYESREWKYIHYELLRVDPAQVDLIDINEHQLDKSVRVTDGESIKKGIRAIQKDIYEETYEEIMEEKPDWASVEVILKNGENDERFEANGSWEKSYVHFDNWLKEMGKYEQARIIPEDIEYALVEKIAVSSTGGLTHDIQKEYRTNQMPDISELENKPGTLKITDPAQLEKCLRSFFELHKEESDYYIYFKPKDGNVFVQSFEKESAPNFVRVYLDGEK
ncbi:MAG: DUF6449 domain-containing protein [Bacillota bacterium]|nr:DUF6449 domain-containing protein [Bacillota bacterium]